MCTHFVWELVGVDSHFVLVVVEEDSHSEWEVVVGTRSV